MIVSNSGKDKLVYSDKFETFKRYTAFPPERRNWTNKNGETDGLTFIPQGDITFLGFSVWQSVDKEAVNVRYHIFVDDDVVIPERTDKNLSNFENFQLKIMVSPFQVKKN